MGQLNSPVIIMDTSFFISFAAREFWASSAFGEISNYRSNTPLSFLVPEDSRRIYERHLQEEGFLDRNGVKIVTPKDTIESLLNRFREFKESLDKYQDTIDSAFLRKAREFVEEQEGAGEIRVGAYRRENSYSSPEDISVSFSDMTVLEAAESFREMGRNVAICSASTDVMLNSHYEVEVFSPKSFPQGLEKAIGDFSFLVHEDVFGEILQADYENCRAEFLVYKNYTIKGHEIPIVIKRIEQTNPNVVPKLPEGFSYVPLLRISAKERKIITPRQAVFSAYTNPINVFSYIGAERDLTFVENPSPISKRKKVALLTALARNNGAKVLRIFDEKKFIAKRDYLVSGRISMDYLKTLDEIAYRQVTSDVKSLE